MQTAARGYLRPLLLLSFHQNLFLTKKVAICKSLPADIMACQVSMSGGLGALQKCRNAFVQIYMNLYERVAGWYCRQIELHLNIQLKVVVVVVPVIHISNGIFRHYMEIPVYVWISICIFI